MSSSVEATPVVFVTPGQGGEVIVQQWFLGGSLHRDGGPACLKVHSDGTVERFGYRHGHRLYRAVTRYRGRKTRVPVTTTIHDAPHLEGTRQAHHRGQIMWDAPGMTAFWVSGIPSKAVPQ